MAIRLLTHNGRERKDGGLCIGYQDTTTGWALLFSQGYRWVDLCQLKPKPAKPSAVRQAAVVSAIDYWGLSTTDYYDPRCTNATCRSRSIRSTKKQTDSGERLLYECLECHTLMRPVD